jgi:hypothetical protein
MMLTKKRIEECTKLVDQFGYWSEQVKDYISQFPYHTAEKLHNKMINHSKGRK